MNVCQGCFQEDQSVKRRCHSGRRDTTSSKIVREAAWSDFLCWICYHLFVSAGQQVADGYSSGE